MGGEDDDDDDDPLLRAVAHAPDASPPDGTALVGRSVGRFRVLRKVGAGGMGVVYEAEDEGLGRRVALKVLPRSDDEHARARFLREAKSASRVVHPNVAVVYEVGEADGVLFIAMELIDGETLESWMGGAWTLGERLRVASEVAAAMAAAHERGIVHRDLKPGNVMIASGSAKVLDFGLAKQHAASLALDDTATAASGDRLIGTPAYMSPEQVKGKAVGPGSDVFAFGVILYELVTGTKAFRRDTLAELLIAIDRDEPARVTDVRADVPVAIVAIVERCMQKRPEARFADGRALYEALEKARREVERTGTARATRWGVVAIGAVIVAMAAVALRGRVPVADGASTAGAASASASASASVAPTAITSLPPPKSGNAEAVAAYDSALQSLRDASIPTAQGALIRALGLDPSFAAAHLRMLLPPGSWGTIDERRRHFRTAAQGRASLSDRDRELLSVVEPVVITVPPDFDESLRRVTAVAARYRGDADVALLAGMYLSRAGRSAEAIAEYDRALALDPEFALALHARAVAQIDQGDLDGGFASASRCLEISPLAGSCVRRRADVFAQRGACAEFEAEARRDVAVEPAGDSGYRYLAHALASRGAPIESIRDVLTTMVGVLDAAHGRREEEVTAASWLALYTGDFVELEARVRELDRLKADDPSESARGANALFQIYEETGDSAKALRLAESSLKRLPGLTPDDPGTRARIIDVLRQQGRLAELDYRAKRDAWIAEQIAWNGAGEKGGAWLAFFADVAHTPADAREALGALPRFLPLPQEMHHYSGSLVGRVYLLAGDVDGAIERLRTATNACAGLEDRHAAVRAHAQLGEALAAKGDKAGACTEFRRVVELWGSAKPRSITVEQARAGIVRLGGCGK